MKEMKSEAECLLCRFRAAFKAAAAERRERCAPLSDGVIDQHTKWPHQEIPPLSEGSDRECNYRLPALQRGNNVQILASPRPPQCPAHLLSEISLPPTRPFARVAAFFTHLFPK